MHVHSITNVNSAFTQQTRQLLACRKYSKGQERSKIGLLASRSENFLNCFPSKSDSVMDVCGSSVQSSRSTPLLKSSHGLLSSEALSVHLNSARESSQSVTFPSSLREVLFCFLVCLFSRRSIFRSKLRPGLLFTRESRVSLKLGCPRKQLFSALILVDLFSIYFSSLVRSISKQLLFDCWPLLSSLLPRSPISNLSLPNSGPHYLLHCVFKEIHNLQKSTSF